MFLCDVLVQDYVTKAHKETQIHGVSQAINKMGKNHRTANVAIPSGENRIWGGIAFFWP